MDLVEWVVWGTVVATVLVAIGMAIGTLLSGRPFWTRLVLYVVGVSALIGLGSGLAAAELVAALWILCTAVAFLWCLQAEPAAHREHPAVRSAGWGFVLAGRFPVA